MRKPTGLAICFIVLAATSGAEAAIIGSRPVNFRAEGVYDELEQDNAVDKNAGFDPSNSTGVGENEDLVVGMNDFMSLLPMAFDKEHGGVVSFDDDTIEADNQIGSFGIDFGRKTLKVSGAGYLCTESTAKGSTPISGPGPAEGCGFLYPIGMEDPLAAGGRLEFSLKELGFRSGEHVRAIAGTILGSSGGLTNTEPWVMRATLDNGDVIAAAAPVDGVDGDATDDTFFGVYAPPGRYITGVSWDGGEVFHGLDGLAFITSSRDIVIAKNDLLYGDEDPLEVAASAAGGVGLSGLFGSSNPSGGTYVSSTNGAESASGTNNPAGTSTNTDYSALFGADRADAR